MAFVYQVPREEQKFLAAVSDFRLAHIELPERRHGSVIRVRLTAADPDGDGMPRSADL